MLITGFETGFMPVSFFISQTNGFEAEIKGGTFMDYSNRMYYWEIEHEYNVHFPMLQRELSGKALDGMTDAQKRKLWAIGVNITGIKYKGSACAIITFVENLDTHKKKESTKKINLFQIIYSKNGRSYKSKHLYKKITDADYAAGKYVPPEYDVKIEPYIDDYYMTMSGECFADAKDARATGENFWRYACV